LRVKDFHNLMTTHNTVYLGAFVRVIIDN